MANAILIKSGGGGVTSDDVTLTSEYMLEGKTSLTIDSNDEIVEGRMKDVGAESKTLSAGESHTITKGHHNGNGVIKAKDLASQTSGTATTAYILKNQTAWVNGKQLTGAMPDNGAVSKELKPGESCTITKGYHNGNGKITTQSLSTICSGCTVTSNAQMLSGYKALGKNGTLYTGSIASLAGGTYTASQTQRTISCKGKYMTSDIIISATNVQSIISFSFASRNYVTANFKWTNPSKGPFYGIVIRGKQGGYPSSVSDGKEIFSGYGTNTNPSGISTTGFVQVGTNQESGQWYFTAYSYYLLNGNKMYDSGKQTSAIFNCHDCISYCSDSGCHERYCSCDVNDYIMDSVHRCRPWCDPQDGCGADCGSVYLEIIRCTSNKDYDYDDNPCSNCEDYPDACNANV